MKKALAIIAILALGSLFVFLAESKPSAKVMVGSKKFTEGVILGDIAAQLIKSAGISAEHRRQLGGTRILWSALIKGDIDCYPEYTGTLFQEILADKNITTERALRNALADKGVYMSKPLGFNNTYAIGMKQDRAGRLGIIKISDLRSHPDLAFGFTNEFMDRQDGWPGLKSRYRLPQKDVRGLDHDLAYRGLASGTIAVTDLYSTDAEIEYYNIATLEDDKGYFPRYDAVLLCRTDLLERAPDAIAALSKLEGGISERDMIEMNARAKLHKEPERIVAANFLERTLDIQNTVSAPTVLKRLLKHTKEHLFLVLISLTAAILIALPFGVIAARIKAFSHPILAVVGIIQTIPSLALLVFMIPLLGIGGPPAIVALFLYSLLPIVRNTYSGLHDVPAGIRESAAALGLSATARLIRIDLPMASRQILAGIKTSAVINVGTATLGALIGAGGYGQPILTGIRLDDIGLILQGAIPAAALALLVQGGFDLLERFLVPKGLRLRPVE